MKMFVIGILMLSFSSYAAGEILKFEVTIHGTLLVAKNKAENQFKSWAMLKHCKPMSGVTTADTNKPAFPISRTFIAQCESIKKDEAGLGKPCLKIFNEMKREAGLFQERVAVKKFNEAEWAISAYKQLLGKFKSNQCN